MKHEKGKMTDADLDKRVRERLLANGKLEPKTLERHLAELPDLDGLAETIPYEQPALSDGGLDDNEDL